MDFKRQIEDLLKFDIDDTREFDASMATGYTLIAARNKMHEFKEKKKPTTGAAKGLERVFRKHKIESKHKKVA
jgi:hypothetical protein